VYHQFESSSTGAACVPEGEDSTRSSVLLWGVDAMPRAVSILLLVVNVKTFDVEKMIPENVKQKNDKQRTPLIVVFWCLPTPWPW
jgi:hypothetical protein